MTAALQGIPVAIAWPTFTAPAAAWLFLLTIPLVALYFLKLRRPRTEVTSLTLWRQLIEDQRVNSPFQRFRRNLPLLLQLLALALFVLAAMQPVVRADVAADRTLVLLDRSASMGGVEQAGGPTRFDLARARVLESIDALGADQELAIIAFDRTARLVAPFSADRRLLRRALHDVAVAALGSDLDEALRMAEAMSRAQRIDRVVLLSDGNLPPDADADLPFAIDFQRLPPAGGNLGITELSARRDPGHGWSVFVRIDSSLGDARTATLEWRADDAILRTEPVTIGAGHGQRFIAPLETDTRTRIEVRLVPDGFDALAIDDQAWLDLAPPRDLRVFVAPALAAYRRALEAQDGVVVLPAPGATETTPSGLYDLIVVDTADTPDAAALVRLHDGAIPAELAALVTRTDTPDAIVDWTHDEPLLEHVDLAAVYLSQHVEWNGDARVDDVERQRFEILVHGQNGPLAVHRTPGFGALQDAHDYWLLFDTAHSTLPYRIGFPVLVANAVREAAQRAGLLETAAVATGMLPLLQTEPGAVVRVTAPDGTVTEATADRTGVLSGIAARAVGIHELTTGATPLASFGVALLDSRETWLDTLDRFTARELAVEARVGPVGVDRPWTTPLVTLALLVLLLEWWVVHHRPAPLRGGRP